MAATLAHSVVPTRAATPAVKLAPVAARAVRTSPSALMLAAGPPAHRLHSVLSPRAIADLASGGDPLLAPVRARLEATFGVSLADIRVRSDQKAQQAVAAVGARAFAHGHHIFLGPGESPGDIALLAHEVAHVIQQHGAVPAVQMLSRDAPSSSHEREASQAAATALSGGTFTVRERTRDFGVQRFGISDALDWIADHANNIPGFRMLTIILGTNPINLRRVERSAANVLRAIIEFLPGGALITQALDNYGIIERVGSWISGQIDTLGLTWSAIKQALTDFIDSLGLRDLFHLGDVWDRAVRIFTTPIQRIIDFGRSLVDGVIRFIKDAILRPLAELASRTAAWDLLCAVLGRNPITGDAVPRTAETLIGGFMKMIGQEEIWHNIQRARAIPRAWAWFQGALEGLLGFVRQIPTLFLDALRSLELMDIVLVPRAFVKIGRVFGSFFGRFFSWAGGTIWSLLEIIFEVLAPSVMPYLRKAAGAFRTILRNPIGFIQNLVRAGVQGFRQFATNFLTHLRAALVAWLTGALGGVNVYIPQSLDFREIIKFVLSVLGLTWQNVRAKLVRRIGETAVRVLETTFDIVVTLVRDGPAAAWEKIKEQLTNLKDMVMEGIMTFVRERIVQAAITRLLTSLNPAGAFIQAILAIYNTIMFLVERLRQIAQVVTAFIDSIAAIAGGAIGAAANRVEQTMEGLLTLVISFLARLVGLGRVSDAVVNIINRVREPIDRAIDRVIDWIVTAAQRIGRAVAGAVTGNRPQVATAGGTATAIGEEETFSAGGESHRLWIQVDGSTAEVMLASAAEPLSQHLVEFRADARDLDDGPDKTALLGWISQALPLARSIETDSRRAAALTIDSPERNTIDLRVRQNERAIRVPLGSILDALGARVPTQITPQIAVAFAIEPGIDLGEYDRQLALQQSAINTMVVADWITNRMRYAERRSETGSGRHPESGTVQQDLRAQTRALLVQRLQRPADATGGVASRVNQQPYLAGFVESVFNGFSETTRRRGLAESTAEGIVNSWLSTQHALHSPDQVAGGSHTDLTGVGLGVVNSDIGANWGGWGQKPVALANWLERQVRDSMTRLRVRRAFWRAVRMNIALHR